VTGFARAAAMAILSLKNQAPILMRTARNRKMSAVVGPPIRYPAATRIPPRVASRITVFSAACQLERPVVVIFEGLLFGKSELAAEYRDRPQLDKQLVQV
jgi:hypothetical protein